MPHSIKRASFGSISEGTLRCEDLIPTLAWELNHHLGRQVKRFPRKAHRALIREAERLDFNTPQDAERASEVLGDLYDALGEFAPPGGYFGGQHGDPACVGFFISDGFFQDFDGLKVNDTSEVPANYRGEVLHVNDHGNATLYVAGPRQKLTEVWAVV